jgi:hypothetical protein
MLDPRDIPRPNAQRTVSPCRMVTRADGPTVPAHQHRAYPDASGNGATDVVASHFHYIQGGQVLPGADGHTHKLLNILCGAGR